MTTSIPLLAAALAILAASCTSIAQTGKASTRNLDWPAYNGGPQQTHYSPLAEMNRSNIGQLKIAWTYDTGEPGGKGGHRSLETNPIVVDGILYSYTPSQDVFALDAVTGRLLWKFHHPGLPADQPNRGLAYWDGGGEQRIFAGITNFVYALDAKTGKPIPTFGADGRIDLRENLGREPSSVIIAETSPGIVYKDLLIVGGMEPETLPTAPGDIRAYDVRTGKLRWSFHTIPHPGEFGYNTWPKDAWKYAGSANNWAGMTLDARRGIVYVPTGSAASDFYKANELGDDLFANCLIALNADTGKRIWHFQTVRHDLWDRDLPSSPVLVTVQRNGREVDAVAQTTKSGFVYLFDRVTGEPLFPISYHKYPPSDVPGEAASSEQPLPDRPAPFARQRLTADLLSNRSPEVNRWARSQFSEFRSEGQFLPFTVGKKTVLFPGFDGGGEWGGPAIDPQTGILYVNGNDVAWTGELAKNTAGEGGARGLYLRQCSLCHGDHMKGSPPDFPSLVGIRNRLGPFQVRSVIRNGRGRMPGFSNLSTDQLLGLTVYLLTGEDTKLQSSGDEAPGMDYRFTGYEKFLDPDGYPAVAPPWGTLNAIDLNTGEYVWKIPFGEYPELRSKGIKDTGTENYGGPLVTAGGLLFIGATNFDNQFRAFDKSTGKVLWQVTLPFAANATPAAYEVNGRQYVVVAAGGGKASGSLKDAVYIAFALSR